MEEIIVNQKKFISAKRAARVSKYTSDYVGQLCRKSALDCTRVGKIWFVTEESLLKHKELSLASGANAGKKKGKEEAKPFVMPGIPRVTIIKNEKVEVLPRGEIISDEVYSSLLEKNVLTYHKDENLLFPKIKKEKKWTVNLAPAISHSTSVPAFQKVSNSSTSLSHAHSGNFWMVVPVMLLILVSTLFMQTFLSSSNFVKDSSLLTSASFESVRGLLENFQKIKNSAFAFVSRKDAENFPVEVVEDNQVAPDTTSRELNGMAVFPSSNTLSKDEIAKNDIKNSFSDEVTVSPDESGTAGVITPIFREATSTDFIYVLVPVLDKEN